MNKLVIATSNPHKVEELRAIFAASSADLPQLLTLAHIKRPLTEPVESGGTFEANATIKAIDYARQCAMWCLADDSGLEVDALGGRPGVISSHYCTDGVERGMSREERDLANNLRVMSELESVRREERGARFRCVMVLADPSGGVLHVTQGVCEGRIGEKGKVPRGAHGFGYDPIFLVGPEFTQTSAELAPAVKNAMSHRARAAEQMAGWFAGRFRSER